MRNLPQRVRSPFALSWFFSPLDHEFRAPKQQDAATAKRSGIRICIGERVQELRSEQGRSQQAFTHESELDRTYVNGVERREWKLTLSIIEKIASTLGISISELMEGL